MSGWDDIIRGANLTGRTKMIRRDELKPGDRAISSHYGPRTVASATQYGTEGQTTHIVWESSAEHPLSERYDSALLIPLVVEDAWIITTHHARCSLCNEQMNDALAAARMAVEAISTYNKQGHGATVERETYEERRKALGLS